MQHTHSCPPSGSLDLESHPVFNVVIAYEDFETGKHAKQTYDYLVEHAGQECPFSNQMWKFEVLSIPNLRELAVNDAAQADLIIISSRGGDFPAQVKAWIEEWSKEPSHALAVVALFTCDGDEPATTHAVRSYLSSVAKRGSMEFFAQPDDWPDQRPLLIQNLELRGATRCDDATARREEGPIPSPEVGYIASTEPGVE